MAGCNAAGTACGATGGTAPGAPIAAAPTGGADSHAPGSADSDAAQGDVEDGTVAKDAGSAVHLDLKWIDPYLQRAAEGTGEAQLGAPIGNAAPGPAALGSGISRLPEDLPRLPDTGTGGLLDEPGKQPG